MLVDRLDVVPNSPGDVERKSNTIYDVNQNGLVYPVRSDSRNRFLFFFARYRKRDNTWGGAGLLLQFINVLSVDCLRLNQILLRHSFRRAVL
jgi:hypothetical protein